VLVTLADVVASDPALAACNPDWTATLDLSLHGVGWLTEGPVVVETRLVRVGKKIVVVAADAYDGRGQHDLERLVTGIDAVREGAAGSGVPALAATGLVTFARLPRAAASGIDDHDPASWVGQVRRRAVGHPVEGTIYERMGIRSIDPAAGAHELDRTSYVVNSIGTINGGAQAILLQVAAEGLRPGMAARDIEVHYLSQVEAGPARTRGRVLRDGDDHSVVRVELVDAGADDQLLALATITLQRPPR
jgi:acyl-coenzyme A thioesterase PaaI-like protein